MISSRDVTIAGHKGDLKTATLALSSPNPDIRASALSALHRLHKLTEQQIESSFRDQSPHVRRRAAETAAKYPTVNLLPALSDPDDLVVEVAAWSCGEHQDVSDEVLQRLIDLATSHANSLVRESAAAALGAIGDLRGLPAILKACSDKPAVRRRAVLALAPFEGPEVEEAIDKALTDKDWQVRQSAEDLRR